jgi:hypothetical protein
MNKWFVYLVILCILFFQNVYEPHRWCNGYCVCLECGRSKIRAPISSNYKIGICCFSAKHAALRRKNKDWLARNQDNVFEWGDFSIHGLMFQWASAIKKQLGVLVKNKVDLIIISLKINLFSPWYSWKIAELALNNNHSLTQNVYGLSV